MLADFLVNRVRRLLYILEEKLVVLAELFKVPCNDSVSVILLDLHLIRSS